MSEVQATSELPASPLPRQKPSWAPDSHHIRTALAIFNALTALYFAWLIYDYFQVFIEEPDNDLVTALLSRAIYATFALTVGLVALRGHFEAWMVSCCFLIAYIGETFFVWRYLHSEIQSLTNFGIRIYSNNPDNQIIFMHYAIFGSFLLLGYQSFRKKYRTIDRIICFVATSMVLGISFMMHSILIEHSLFPTQERHKEQLVEAGTSFSEQSLSDYCKLMRFTCTTAIQDQMIEMPNGFAETRFKDYYDQRLAELSERPGDSRHILLKLEDTFSALDNNTLLYANNEPGAQLPLSYILDNVSLIHLPRVSVGAVRYRAYILLVMTRLEDGSVKQRLIVDDLRNKELWIHTEWQFSLVVMVAAMFYLIGSVALIYFHRYAYRRRYLQKGKLTSDARHQT